MLEQVAEGVFVRTSEFLESKSIVVQGAAGILLIDPGITGAEMDGLADDLGRLGQHVVAGFSTHPHWDHLLWHPRFGQVPRYGTAACATDIREFLAQEDWKNQVAEALPPDIGPEIPMELLGQITELPAGSPMVPWAGPDARVIEHRAHAHGHAALLIEGRGVLVAGDMLSDILIPFLDLEAVNPLGDYLAALLALEGAAGGADVIITGHGSVGGGGELRARIAQDRAYVQALRDGTVPDDPRVGPDAASGMEWLVGVHEWQLQQIAERRGPDRPGSN